MASGTKTVSSRNQWYLLDQQLAEGDALVVAAVNRLGRRYIEMLVDVAPAGAAQVGAQGGRCLDHSAQYTARTASSQHVSVVDESPLSQIQGTTFHTISRPLIPTPSVDSG